MADTYTTTLRQRLMEDGSHESDWGDRTNDNLQILEQGINGFLNVSLPTSGSYNLTTNNGSLSGDEARQKTLNLIGTPTGAVNIVVPSVDKIYVIRNSTGGTQDITISTSGGTPVDLKRGYDTIILCDGTDCYEYNPYVGKRVTDNDSDITSIQNQIATLQAQVASLEGSQLPWPVGSYFFSHVSTNPNTLLGYGTWVREAVGKFIVGQNTSDSDFNSPGETGGSKNRTLVTSNLPSHNHSLTININGGHTHPLATCDISGIGTIASGRVFKPSSAASFSNNPTTDKLITAGVVNTNNNGAHTHSGSIGNTGSGTSFEILPPYHVLYVWRRTA